jgi:hypothetical protein
VRNSQGESEMVRVKLERPRMFHATVFNATQIDGLPPVQRPEGAAPRWNAVERAETILAASCAAIRHESGNRAFYRGATDSIHLPQPGQFASADRYYATALHELGHWTGHASRLDRDLSHPFGSEGYAREELRAEIASLILGDALGIGHDPGQHAAYVKSWIQVLENDPLEIVRAAADAEKIQRFVMSFEQVQQQENIRQPGVEVSTAQGLDGIQPVVRPDLFDSTEGQVGQLQNHLVVDAHVEMNQLDQAAKLARLKDDAMRRDSTSTDEQRDAEKEDRQRTNAAAVAADPVLSARLEQLGREHDAHVSRAPRAEAAPQPISTRKPGKGEAVGKASFLKVSYREKNEAKALGAKWDRQEQAWYVPAGVDPAVFTRWFQVKPAQAVLKDQGSEPASAARTGKAPVPRGAL